MKAFKRLRIVALSALVWLFNSCGDPLEDFSVHLSPVFYSQMANFYLYDVAGDESFLTDVNVTVTGPDAQYIYAYDASRNFDASNGALSLILSPEAIPSRENPIEFWLKFFKPGYEDKSVRVILDQQEAVSSQNVYMLSKSNLPEGTSYVQQTASLNSNGALENPLSIAIPPAPGSTEGASLSLPQGVTFYDENGAQLTGTSIDVEVILFDGFNENTLKVIPIAYSLVNNEPVLFNDFGFSALDIEMRINGSKVKSFQNGQLNFGFDLNPTIIDPIENRPLQAGDSIALLSSSHGSIEWEWLGTELIQNSSGNLQVFGSSSHLSIKRASQLKFSLGLRFLFIDQNGFPLNVKSVTITAGNGGSQVYSNSIVSHRSYEQIMKSSGFQNYNGLIEGATYSTHAYTVLQYNDISNIEVTLHNGEVITDFVEEFVEVQTGGFIDAYTINSVVLKKIILPEPKKITVPFEIYCESDPKTKYYPPVGYIYLLYDQPPLNPGVKPFLTRVVTDPDMSEIVLMDVEEGFPYLLSGVHPNDLDNTYFLAPVIFQNNVLVSIGLQDNQCTQLKKLLPGS